MERSHVVFIGGRSGVGKTTTAYALSQLLQRLEVQHAVIEGDNLDEAWPAPYVAFPDAKLAERNLAAMWANYRALGYRRLIYTNTASVVHVADLVAAMGDEPEVVAVLLRAGGEAVRERLGARERGESLRTHLERSAAAARELDATAGAAVHRLDTDGLDPDAVAERLLTLLSWTSSP